MSRRVAHDAMESRIEAQVPLAWWTLVKPVGVPFYPGKHLLSNLSNKSQAITIKKVSICISYALGKRNKNINNINIFKLLQSAIKIVRKKISKKCVSQQKQNWLLVSFEPYIFIHLHLQVIGHFFLISNCFKKMFQTTSQIGLKQ